MNLRKQPNQPLPFLPPHTIHSILPRRSDRAPFRPNLIGYACRIFEEGGREPEGWFRLVDGKRSDDKGKEEEEEEEEDEGGGREGGLLLEEETKRRLRRR